jgi:hypothetical protein
VNGDRAPDQILAGGHGCVLPTYTQRNDQQVLLNDGRGFFRPLPGALPVKPFDIAGEGQSIVVTDLDRDGHPDLLIAYTSGRQRATDCSTDRVQGRLIQVLMGNGDGTFRDETSARLPQPDAHESSYDYYESLALADVDGDGSPDLFTQLVIPPWGDPAYAPAYRNDGRGFFKPLPRAYPNSNLNSSVSALLDLSGKGRRDVVILDSHGRGDLVYRRSQLDRTIRPGTPTDVRVTTDPATGQVVVAWPYVWGAARYEVWRSGRRIGVTRSMRFVDTSPASSPYTVRAVNSAGAGAFSGDSVVRSQTHG